MTVSGMPSSKQLIRDAKKHLAKLKKISASPSTFETTNTYGDREALISEPIHSERPFRFNPDSPSNWDYWDFFYGHLTIPVLPIEFEAINHAAAVCLRSSHDVGGTVYRMRLAGWPNHMRNKLTDACCSAINDIETYITLVNDWNGSSRAAILASQNDSDTVSSTTPAASYIAAFLAAAEDMMHWVIVDQYKNPELWFETSGIEAEELPALSDSDFEIYSEEEPLSKLKANVVVNHIPIDPLPKDRPISNAAVKDMIRAAKQALRASEKLRHK